MDSKSLKMTEVEKRGTVNGCRGLRMDGDKEIGGQWVTLPWREGTGSLQDLMAAASKGGASIPLTAATTAPCPPTPPPRTLLWSHRCWF